MTLIDREALARALYDSDVTGIFMLPAQREARWIGQREGYLHHVGALAPLIAAAVDAARTEAWDEGYRASYDFERGEVYPEPTNPYRKATP